MHDDKTDQNHLGAGGRGVLLGILQGGVLAGSSNPDPISDQKLAFSTPIFRPDILSPYPFSDLAFRQKICHNYLIILECDKKMRTSNAFWIHVFLFLSYSFGIEMNSRSSFENHTQFQTLTLTPNPGTNPNNPPPPPPDTHTKDQHFESEGQPSNSQHNAFQTGFVRSEMVTWSDIHPF